MPINRPTSPPPPAASARPRHLLQEAREFSASLLWDLQRAYFADRGVAAWGRGEVPHYITSNPVMGHAYAEIVFANWCDQQRPDGVRDPQPFTVLELGAGSGRFAFHFLQRLTALCADYDLPPATAFRYIMSDQAAANLEFWRAHPRLQPFFESGLLDLALFDLVRDETVRPLLGGGPLAAGSLRRPLAVIANYVFDSVPQELFHFANGHASRCRVTLTVDSDPAQLDAAGLIRHVVPSYESDPQPGPAHAEPWLQAMIGDYARTLDQTHLLFPATALRCLERLVRFSPQGLLLLSADKGEHQLAGLQGRPPPDLVRHGSFSLSVNYHAIKTFCEQRGGVSLFPTHRDGLNISCSLVLAGMERYAETRRAYRQHVDDFGPDDFFRISRHARRDISAMKVADLLAYVRLGRHDAHLFAQYVPRLTELAPAFSIREQQAVLAVIEAVWRNYFPIGERHDLARGIGGLLQAMGEHAPALAYFERSLGMHGRDPAIQASIAACRMMAGRRNRTPSPAPFAPPSRIIS